MQWHIESLNDLSLKLETDLEMGLSEAEASARLQKIGRNVLPEPPPDPAWLIFLRQFQSPFIYVLLVAAVIVALTGNPADAMIIGAVLVLNAIVGSVQEGRAQASLTALKSYIETKATVLRGGQEVVISDSEVVPGDMLMLREGEKIAADARIVRARNLKVSQGALTGESGSVHKVEQAKLDEHLPPAEQSNMVFKGTAVAGGEAQAVVVATGLETVIGGISQTLQNTDTELPLRRSIENLSKLILWVVALAGLAIFALGTALGNSIGTMFGIVVSVAVSAIPEGLPVVLTIVLSAGVWRMARRNALVKRLAAVEALGQAKVIALDKTGTITKNELVIREIWTADGSYEVHGIGYERSGAIEDKSGEPLVAANHPNLLLSGKLATFCANARVALDEASKSWSVSGDPTEAALLVLGEKLGFRKDELERECPLVEEVPFDYMTKYHLTVHQEARSGSRGKGREITTVAGAPEHILALATRIFAYGESVPLTVPRREALEAALRDMSSRALRLVAIAYRSDVAGGGETRVVSPSDLTFVGIFGIEDSPRPEVRAAIERARTSGFRVVMITGDHRLTAIAIAREAGIYRDGDGVIEGSEIDKLAGSELAQRLQDITVFARVTPEHKLRIIEGFRERGEIVAMTGDGVNDAPSLVAADLGIAMGQGGTEVAREASDIVLLDNNFETIVGAIEEGRSIYKTIRKVILYTFSTSLSMFGTILGTFIFGWPLPLYASQIIWMNLVTDGFPVIALGLEPKERGLLERPFRKPTKYIFDAPLALRMVMMATPMILGSLYIFQSLYGADLAKAVTMTATALTVFQWFNAWNCRSEERSILTKNPVSNRALLWAMTIAVGLQVLAIYWGPLQEILHYVPLAAADWLLLVGISFSVVLVDEGWKAGYRYYLARQSEIASSKHPSVAKAMEGKQIPSSK